MHIYFSILGSLTAELRSGDPHAPPTILDTGPLKQSLLLAILLCRANAVVSVEELVDGLWWEGPPRTAHKNVQVYISHIRKLLAADGRRGRLLYRPSGYQLVLSAAEVDALRFEDLSREGRLTLRGGDASAAANAMRQALGLWRGAALADLQVSPALREEAARLDDRRLAAYEDWFEAELLLGNHVEVLAEVDSVVRAHPLRERLRSHQLTALYRGGRQAEALAEYDNLRQLLTSELGLDPSPALRQLYQGILSGHPGLAAPLLAAVDEQPEPSAAGAAVGLVAVPDAGFGGDDVVPHIAGYPETASVPSGLPRAVEDFTGRQDALAELLAYFGDGSNGTSHLRRFAAVVGPPGAGTSTLALQAAHVIAPRFRDGQILLPCRDPQGMPRPPMELVDDLLELLAPPPRRPSPARDLSIALRSRLAGLQLLLILDDVAADAQIRPLLPGMGDCSVILTSCRALSGLDGVRRFPIGTFTEDEALSLLVRLIGRDRVADDPAAASRIVAACGLLPLAVRIAGARLAGLGHLPLERFARRLEDEGKLLDELSIGDLSVRECFDRYVQGLDSAERLALMLVVATRGFPPEGLVGMEQLLERLAGVHALTITDREVRPASSPSPFEMPAPLWVYAQQLVTAAVGDGKS